MFADLSSNTQRCAPENVPRAGTAALFLAPHDSAESANLVANSLERLSAQVGPDSLIIWLESANGGHPGPLQLEANFEFQQAAESGSVCCDLASLPRPQSKLLSLLRIQYDFGLGELKSLSALDLIGSESDSMSFNRALTQRLQAFSIKNPALQLRTEPVDFEGWLSCLRTLALSMVFDNLLESGEPEDCNQAALITLNVLAKHAVQRNTALVKEVARDKDHCHAIVSGESHKQLLQDLLSSSELAFATLHQPNDQNPRSKLFSLCANRLQASAPYQERLELEAARELIFRFAGMLELAQPIRLREKANSLSDTQVLGWKEGFLRSKTLGLQQIESLLRTGNREPQN